MSDTSDFTGANVLITGGSAGVGRTIAEQFATAGANVAILDSNTLAKDITDSRLTDSNIYLADVCDEPAVVAAVAKVAERFEGRFDVLVNNAGFNGHFQRAEDADIEMWQHTMNINLYGMLRVTKQVLPYMKQAGHGAITNVASNVAKRGLPYRGDYVCSKWAVLGLTQTLALEHAESNLRVNAVCPGPIHGDRIKAVVEDQAKAEGRSAVEVEKEWASAAPMNRFVYPEEVASTVLFLSGSGASAMTGQALNVTGGFLMH